jgi:hypothetical protein
MVAVGLCLTLLLDGRTAFGVFWLFVSAAWGAFTFKLWRMHLDWYKS